MSCGFTEEQVLDMPLDKYELYLRAEREVDFTRRRKVVIDTSAAIGGLFEKDGVVNYINSSLSGE